ncbi:hypothetical protein PMAYCL1PPCAC_00057, partial [Pristionchus mayeri]
RMSFRSLVKELGESVRRIHKMALESLSNGMSMVQIRAICEYNTQETVRVIRGMILTIKSAQFHPHKDLIPDLEDTISVGERTLELVRPRGA